MPKEEGVLGAGKLKRGVDKSPYTAAVLWCSKKEMVIAYAVRLGY